MKIHSTSAFAAFAFSILFYSKSFGLNIFLMSIIVVVALTVFKRQQGVPWGYALAYLFTGTMVFIDPTGFKIFIYFMSFLVLVGKSISDQSPVYLSWFMGLVNMVIASVFHLSKPQKHEHHKITPKIWTAIKGSLLALVLLLFFGSMYRSANPVFEDLITQIDLSFISIPWVLFTLVGYIMFLHVLRPYHPEGLIALDARQLNTLLQPNAPFTIPQLEKLRNEQTLGSIIFAALNLLLLFYLITDAIYLSQVGEISNSEYSQSVHQGVYALMFSLVCAIVIILYFFRGNLNFFKGNHRIKILSHIWLCLNVVLLAFTWYKNYQYVDAMGLTYKRIGVFVYLLLTLTGLVTALVKVMQTKSFMYLVRTNLASLFAFVLISAAIPWDRAITQYNLEHISNPDMDYLIVLGYTNSDQLYRFANDTKTTMPFSQQARIEEKYAEFSKAQEERTWQEYTLYQIKNR